ncbi:MAG: acyl-[acyl-carrier-protein] thioesterase [Saprospiraceae bacterium]
MALHPNFYFRGNYSIRSLEVDQKQQLTIPALIKLMQETSMQNVISMNVSYWDLIKENVSWVLMRMHIKIKQLPMMNQEVKIFTHPSGFERFFTYRDFKVYDQNEALLAQASSTWLLLNTKERKMSKLPQFILDYEMPEEDECLPRRKTKLPKFERVDQQLDFRVNWYDLDFNAHLNNVLYIQWMLEVLDNEYLESGKILEIDILFRAESKFDDRITAEVQQLGPHYFLHRLVRQSDQKELAKATSLWEL